MIRSARPEDIVSFIALQRCVEDAGEIWGYAADPETKWSARSLAWSFVAVHDGQAVGFIYCEPREHAGECVFPARSRILEITELVVHPEHRDHGHGRQLLASARAQAVRDGFSHLRVYSAAKQLEDVVRFYRSCGFTPWYVELTQPLGS